MYVDVERFRVCDRCNELVSLDLFDVESGLCHRCISDLIEEENYREMQRMEQERMREEYENNH